jgi:hypothetical protein
VVVGDLDAIGSELAALTDSGPAVLAADAI